VQRHYRGASKAWVYSNVSKGVLPPPYKVAGRSFWSRREIIERDDKRRLAEREAA
jgi:predicted DNA-binding transcriptional regulator AlpA